MDVNFVNVNLKYRKCVRRVQLRGINTPLSRIFCDVMICVAERNLIIFEGVFYRIDKTFTIDTLANRYWHRYGQFTRLWYLLIVSAQFRSCGEERLEFRLTIARVHRSVERSVSSNQPWPSSSLED